MSRLRHLSLAALVASALLLLPIASQAQRGGMGGHGGGGMGGARGGGMGMHGGGIGGARIGGVPGRMRTAGVRPGGFATPAGTISRGGRFNRGFVSSGRFRNGRFRNDRFFRDRFFLNSDFFPFGFSPFGFSPFGFSGFGFSPFGFPFFDSFWEDNFAQRQQEQAPASSDSGDAGNLQLAIEVQHLSDQIQELRQEERRAAAAAAPQPQGSISAKTAESTTFVFRDGHRINTENFAIVGDTLWVLTEDMAKKVPLADIDKAATEQANAAKGIELRLP